MSFSEFYQRSINEPEAFWAGGGGESHVVSQNL